MKLTLAFFFFSTVALAEVRGANGISFIDFKFDRQAATVYLSLREARSQDFQNIRISRYGQVADFFFWRGEPFVLDKQGALWALDTSWSRRLLSKTFTAIRASGITAAAVLPFDILLHQYLGFDKYGPFESLFSGYLQIFTFALPFYSLFALLDRIETGNYFTLKVIGGIQSIEKTREGPLAYFESGDAIPIGALLRRADRRVECEDWLRGIAQ